MTKSIFLISTVALVIILNASLNNSNDLTSDLSLASLATLAYSDSEANDCTDSVTSNIYESQPNSGNWIIVEYNCNDSASEPECLEGSETFWSGDDGIFERTYYDYTLPSCPNYQ